jgi:PilZ domain
VKKFGSRVKPETTDQTQTKPRLQDRRVQPRFTTQFRSTFSGAKQEGQGRTLDISVGGCKIESDMHVVPGAKFECRLHVPGLDWPLRIDEATVRWVDANSFGIAFSRITPEEFAKLKSVLSNLEHGE